MDYYSLKMRASEEVEDETAEVLADGSRPYSGNPVGAYFAKYQFPGQNITQEGLV